VEDTELKIKWYDQPRKDDSLSVSLKSLNMQEYANKDVYLKPNNVMQ